MEANAQVNEVVSVLPPIKAKVGEIVEIRVPSNPTTGFVCTLSEMPNCLYLASKTYVPDQPIMPGSGGTEVFSFFAVAKGSGPVEFHDVKYTHPRLTIAPQTAMQKRFVIVE